MQPLTAWVNVESFDTISTAAEAAHPHETGGVLLGWERPERNEVVVAAALGAGPASDADELSFRPDSAWQEQEIAKVYEASGRKVTYLGDWHVHPAGVAVPSRIDKKTLRRIATEPGARAPQPIMAILGATADAGHLGLCVWRWDPSPWWRIGVADVAEACVREWEPLDREVIW